MKKRLKNILKIDSDKKKSILVIVTFFALLGLVFYKNLGDNLKGFYHSRNFDGDIQITGFSWPETGFGLDVNYSYLEKVDGENLKIPLKKSVRFKHLILPYYDDIDHETYSPIEELGSSYDETYRVYLPIIEKALESNPDKVKLEKSLERKLNQAPDLKGSSVKIRSTLADERSFVRGLDWYDYYLKEVRGKGHPALGGLYNFPVDRALANGAVYVQIILPKGVSGKSIDLKNQLAQLLNQLSLPDGAYVLGTIDQAEGYFVVVERGEIRERN